MELPCRSCGNCTEHKFDAGEIIDFIDLTCSEQVALKGYSILTYGVSDAEQGRRMCEKYSHVGFNW
jgi:hypothetical protein